MTHDELARRFAELNNIHWNDNPELCVRTTSLCKNRNIRCKDCMYSVNAGSPNPTYSTVGSVLEVMLRRDDFGSFGFKYGIFRKGHYHLDIDYILERDKLLKAAVDWLKEQNR